MTSESLLIAEEAQVRKELELPEPEKISLDEVAPEIEKQADELVERFASIDPAQVEAAEQGKAAVENMAVRLQEEASHRSAMLEEPLASMADRAEDGGEVANALIELKLKVEELDPGKYDLEPGWLSRLLGRIPGVGTPIKRYFTRFESSQTVIDAILRSLDDGKDQLQHDNATLREDQKHLRELTRKLQRAIQLARLIDRKLAHKTERELVDRPEQVKFICEELLFPLRQRIMDLQQQLAVTQQGVVTLEIVMRNNKELIRGVNRAKHVTVNALQVAVTLAIALANQRIVLDKINAVNETTNELIASTAARLRQQGAEIHKQSADTALDVETLKAAFRDIHAALEDIAKYRQEALPRMENSIREMAQLTDEGERKIRNMERADVAAEDVFEFLPDEEAGQE